MGLLEKYEIIVTQYPFLSGFIKFAVLAVAGEVLAYRIKTRNWPGRAFGILPKSIVWGLLGILIVFAFNIFSKGVPQIYDSLLPFTGHPPADRILNAFYISLFMNIFFAPVMMLLHRIMDIRIEANQGKLSSLVSGSPSTVELLKSVSWERMWGFVFKKTIPLFWIPAHTLTFLLPPTWQILFAAVLSIALGIILAFANTKS